MKISFNNLWRNISQNGLTPDLDEAEKKRIIFLNRLIFIILDVSLLFLVLDLITGAYEAIIIILLSISGFQ